MSTRLTERVDKGQRWLPLLLWGGVCLVWCRALVGPFQFDDYNVIVNFAPVHSLAGWWQGLPGIRPLLKLSYAGNWALSPAPFGFHLFNLLLHLGNGALLWAWARRALPLRPGMALALALLWLLHPLQTEAVTYVSGRSVSLCATFLFAGLLLQARAPRATSLWLALCTALALAVRETAWVFPAVFGLVGYLRGLEPRACLRQLWPAALVVLAAAAGFLLEPHYRHLIDVSFATRDAAAQLRAQVLGLSYLLQQLVSLSPNIDPDLPVPAAWTPGLLALALLLAGGIAAALWQTLRHRSWQAAGWLWFFLLLLPTNGLMPRLDVASERHLYAALAGPLWSLLLWLQGWPFRRAAVAALAGLLALTTLVRNEDYRSELALWGRTVQQSPYKARAWNNLGMACREAGRPDCAGEAFRQALRLEPGNLQAATNLYFLLRDESGRAAESKH